MTVVLQALAFAGCALLDLLPGTDVYCRFDVPVMTWSVPPAPSGPPCADPQAPDCPEAPSPDPGHRPGAAS